MSKRLWMVAAFAASLESDLAAAAQAGVSSLVETGPAAVTALPPEAGSWGIALAAAALLALRRILF